MVGMVVLSASEGVVEQSLRYDDKASCAAALPRSPCMNSTERPANPLCWRELSDEEKEAVQNTCELTLTVQKDMKQPVYFYYEM